MRLTLTAVLALAALSAARADDAIRLAGHPALSPDGTVLAFEWAGDLWSVPAAGGAARPLTRHPGRDARPHFSPDGTKIAFVSDRDGNAQVYVMPAVGGTPKQVTFHTAGYTLHGWHPDGTRLLVSSQRDHSWNARQADRLFLVSADKRAGEELLFDDYGRDGALSPDGRKVLFTREGVEWTRKGYRGSQAGQLWLYDRDSRAFRKLFDDAYGAASPVWKPDGSGFYFTAGKTHADLYEFDLKAGQSKPVTNFPDDQVVQPAISRDGSTLVFRHLFDLYTMKPGNGGPKRLAITRADDREPERTDRRTLTRASEAAFTSDGLEIAIISGGDLWVMDTELREPVAVTRSAEPEEEPVFSADNQTLYFLSDMGGKSDVYKATRADAGKFWWQNTSFKVERVTADGATKGSLTLSPDGKKIAYVQERGNLVVADVDGKNPKTVVKSFSAPSYDWSPDGKWLCYSREDADFNSDVYVTPIDGSRPEFNLSRHPYNDGSPKWSPDGKAIAFVGQREDKDTNDIHFVWLRPEEAERDTRDRTLEKAIEKMQKGRNPLAGVLGGLGGVAPAPAPKKEGEADDVKPAVEPKKADPKPEAKVDPKADPKAERPRRPVPSVPDVVIDFDGIRDRVKRISIPESSEGGLFWSPDGKRLAFQATVEAQRGTYYVDLAEDLKPKKLSSQTGSGVRWLKSGTSIVWLSGGLPGSIAAPAGRTAGPTPSVASTPAPGAAPAAPPGPPGRLGALLAAAGAGPSPEGGYRFTALQEVDLPARNAAAFDLAWRIMRDNWYDERLGNRDWAAVRAKFIDAARECPDVESLAVVVNMMLGELNGSHLGFYPSGSERARRLAAPPGATPAEPGDAGGTWRPVTAHLGVRFDHEFAGPGLRVRDVLPGGPADQKRSRLKAGEVVLKIDGKPLSIGDDLTGVLNGPLARDIALTVKAADGKERVVTLRPTSYAAARPMLYEAWLRSNREAVTKLSSGTLGYLHVSGMDFPSFHKFIEQLYDAGAGKDGLVIDVRENGGGSTADHLLTALSQPRHAVAIPRGGVEPGYPQDRTIYATWHRPIVVLCNQNSFSNAEIFSHAIKTLKRGQLVGVQTAGGVVSTGATTVMDVGMLRLPTRGWYLLNDGEDMELNGAKPDHVLWPQPGDMPRGKDEQLAKAVEVLLADVKADAARARPKLRKATER